MVLSCIFIEGLRKMYVKSYSRQPITESYYFVLKNSVKCCVYLAPYLLAKISLLFWPSQFLVTEKLKKTIQDRWSLSFHFIGCSASLLFLWNDRLLFYPFLSKWRGKPRETSCIIAGRYTFILFESEHKVLPVLTTALRTDRPSVLPFRSSATVCNDISWKHLKFPLPSFYNILRSNFRNDPKEKKEMTTRRTTP